MKSTLRRATAVVMISSAVAGAAPTKEQAELAERFLQTAQRLAAVPAGRAAAAALADVADTMFENDARLYRTAADLRLSLGDRDKALAALSGFRRLDPGDQIAQVQSIDLQQSRLESAGERADYLARVANSDKLAAEVRSHAATLLAGIELERGRDAEAAAAVNQALALNGVNPKALQMKADTVMAGGNAGERVAALVNLLRADPLQFPTASRLGEELLRAGLTDQAAEFYKKFMAAVAAAGYAPSTEDAIAAATVLQIARQDRDAVDTASDALKADPGDMRLHSLRLLLNRAAGDEDGYKTALADARTQAVRNLMGLHTLVDPKAPRLDDATPVSLPDVKADAAAIKAGDDRKLAADYLGALADLAWQDVFFGGRAPDAGVVDAIHALAGQESPLAHRIAGYSALVANRLDEADVAFTPVAATDPLSRLGLLALRQKQGRDKGEIVADAGKLLGELPTDVWPLVIRQAVREAGTPAFRAVDADAVAAEYARLPKETFEFAANGRLFYLVDVEPIGGSVEIGQPILVKVTLQNVSKFPMAIGPGSAVAQQVALDATVRGLAEQSFPAVAVAKLTQRLVVPPKQSVSTVVRVDNIEMGGFLGNLPQVGAAVFVSAVTNPVVRQDGVAPGPGGYRSQGRGVIDRPQVAFNRPETRDALTKQLAAPDAGRRLRAVAAIASCGRFFAQAAGDDTKALAAQAAQLLQGAAEKDASSVVRAMARQEIVTLAADNQKAQIIVAMLQSKDFESRVLGMLLATQARQADRATLLKDLVNDADPLIKNLAVAVANLPDEPVPAAGQATPAK